LSRNQKLSLPNVSLRRLSHEDAYDIFRWRNHPAIAKWCRQFDSLHWTGHWAWIEAQSKDKSMSMYAIEDDKEEKGKIVGVCGFTSIDLINRRAEFSLYIGNEYHGMGLGEAGLRALIKKGFLDYGFNSIWGETFDGNKAAKMFEKVGFKHDGTRRDFYFRAGNFIDAHLYSILRSEYAD
jgi:UDP-4-amino-4,6-dideoxy-N-acetyl-beta-L-altrosamine N-acetyltransferase